MKTYEIRPSASRLINSLRDIGYDFNTAVGLVVRAVIQDPEFLYRVETAGPSPGAAHAIDDFELSTRIAFLLWGAPPDEALGAATEIAIHEPSDEPLDFVAPAAPARSTAGTPRGAAEATMLMGAFADPSSDDAEADLTSLLDDGDDDAVELAGALAEPDDELPRFGAHNAGGPEAEATRIALPDEEDELELSGPIASAEITDADEIDDLFVELLDD